MPAPSLTIVVLSCGALGADVAARLTSVPGVARVTLVTAPYPRPRTLAAKVRRVWRTQGPLGFVRVLAARFARSRAGAPAVTAPPGVTHVAVGDFHDAATIEAIRALAPDLGVVAGTPVLKPSVFEIPRLGSINLHSGKAPEYRGAAPGFWELYHGEREVGITIHRVTAALDAGHILVQEMFPLDSRPAGDPLAYLERYRRDVLHPNGVRLLADAVAAIAAGQVRERPQDPAAARTFRTPDRRATRELRERVAARRRSAPA